VAYFNLKFRYLPGETEETTKISARIVDVMAEILIASLGPFSFLNPN
jgi:hypothetical protein